MQLRQRAPHHDQAAIWPAREGGHGALDLAGVAHPDRADLNSERRRYGLDRAKLAGSCGRSWVSHDCCSGHTRSNLFEQLQPLPAQAVFELHKSGGVTAWAREIVDEAAADRVGDDHEYDGHGVRHFQQGPERHAAVRDDDVRRERGEVGGVLANAGGERSGKENTD
jgi:hypothetical protein